MSNSPFNIISLIGRGENSEHNEAIPLPTPEAVGTAVPQAAEIYKQYSDLHVAAAAQLGEYLEAA